MSLVCQTAIIWKCSVEPTKNKGAGKENGGKNRLTTLSPSRYPYCAFNGKSTLVSGISTVPIFPPGIITFGKNAVVDIKYSALVDFTLLMILFTLLFEMWIIKSLQNDSGQNPLEPSMAGCKIFHGPYVSNFKDEYEYLNSLGITKKINDSKEL